MASDPDFESALQSLLDGRPFTGRPEGPDTPAALGPLGVIQAIARAHRLALFGDEGPGPATGPERVRWGHLEVGEEVGAARRARSTGPGTPACRATSP